MKEFSEVTGKTFESEECVFFRNIFQIAYYVAHNCPIQDVFTDSDMRLVFVFKKTDHKKILPLWMANKDRQTKLDRQNKMAMGEF